MTPPPPSKPETAPAIKAPTTTPADTFSESPKQPLEKFSLYQCKCGNWSSKFHARPDRAWNECQDFFGFNIWKTLAWEYRASWVPESKKKPWPKHLTIRNHKGEKVATFTVSRLECEFGGDANDEGGAPPLPHVSKNP